MHLAAARRPLLEVVATSLRWCRVNGLDESAARYYPDPFPDRQFINVCIPMQNHTPSREALPLTRASPCCCSSRQQRPPVRRPYASCTCRTLAESRRISLHTTHERAAEPGVLCAHPDVCRHALTQTIAWRPACADPTKLPSHLRRPRGSPRDQGARKIGLRARQVDNPTEFSVSTGQRSAGARWCNRGVHSWHANLYATMSKSSMSEGPIPAVASFESAARRAFRSRSSA